MPLGQTDLANTHTAGQSHGAIVHEPDPENLAFTTTWGGGGKFPLYFSESHISWDVISA